MKTPVPEWTKQILAPAGKAEASVSVQDPPMETDVPEEVQEEIRELATQEAAVLETVPPGYEFPPEEVEFDEPEEPEEAEVEAPSEPPEEPIPPRPPRRFEFAFRAGSLKAFLTQLAHLVHEAKVVASRDGWHVLAVDPAHVAMMEVRLTDLLDCFERKNGVLERIEEDVAIGMDVEKLLALVKKAKKDETIHLTADLPNDLDKDELTLELGGMTRTMASIDTEGMADPKIPAMVLPAKVEIPAAELLEAAKAAEDISDHVRLTATREKLNVYAEGDIDRMSVNFDHGTRAQLEIGGTEDTYTSLFPLDYFTKFLKVVKDEKLVVRLGTDYPVRVDWDGATKGTWLLAPRIETE